MLRILFLSFSLIVLLNPLFAKDGHEIRVKLDGFAEKQLMLAYYYADKQYIKDTVEINQDGFFVFEGEEALDPGVYLIVIPPENQYIQIMINEGEQHFTIHTSLNDSVNDFKVDASPDNKLFYDYLKFISKKRTKAEALTKAIGEAKEADKPALQKQLDEINQVVQKEQQKIAKKHAKSLTGAIIKSGIEPKPPKFKEEGEELKMKNFLFYKKHWFDNYNLGDPRLLRSPGLHKRVDYYVHKMTLQHPDSVAIAVDYILEKMRPSQETFKYYLAHFLNKSAKSKIVGMDALYVHIVDKYYATGQASWTEEEQLAKIVKNAKTLKPILVGKIAPDIKMHLLDIEETIKLKDGKDEHKRFKTKGPMNLHEVNSPYTVLFFWDPDCGHCKKSMPQMIEFYEKYKTRGVEVFAVCTRIYKDTPLCATTIKEKNMLNWINVVDPYLKSKFKIIYDIRTTPQIYILDDKKEIISKRIGAEQLSDVMEKILTMPPPPKK